MYAICGKKRKAPMYNQQRSAFSRKDWKLDESKPWGSVGAYFIGPKGENGDIFRELILKAIDHQLQFREKYYPSDAPYVDEEVRQTASYQEVMENTEKELTQMLSEMDKSIPFFSTRYKGHVTWDTVLSANVGYIAGLLYNQNNAAKEGGSVTTEYEIEVGRDLCVMMGFDRDKSRGHLAAGGTIANIEAMWAARNVKFMPLAFKTALQEEQSLSTVRDEYQIYLPQLDKTVKYVDATDWQLLNLDTDAILNIPDEVLGILNQRKKRGEEQVTYEQLMTLMKSYTLESIGAFTFYKKYDIKNAPRVYAPTSAHISLFKGTNITGLGSGDQHFILIGVDKKSRMDMTALRLHLETCLASFTPIVAVVAVMGTTEESAIDPLSDILDLRDEYRTKGLNFIIHADGAWGGYFCSMLREPPPVSSAREVQMTSGFVPELNMSDYVRKQLMGLARCDTVIIDPHKSGFCPYPAGAICYRDERMNNALAVTVQVSYYYGSVNLGDWGLEGSKPGAAAAGVMFANRVIGLHKNGYGRILAECMFSAKMLYCLWCTLPEEGDNFVLQPTMPLESTLVEDPIAFIRTYILEKTNEEIAQDQKAMDFLKEVGPDTLIPCFSVNVKGNTDVQKCNTINNTIMKMLAHATESVTARRRPMLVTASTMSYHKGLEEVPNGNLKDFKTRLGLDPGGVDEKTGIRYIITTCMDPYATSVEFLDDFARIMRNTILCSIGTVEEEAADLRDYHEFVTTGEVDEDLKLIVYYVGRPDPISHQYNVVAKFKFAYADDAKNFMKGSGTMPLVVKTKEKMTLHELLIKEFEDAGQTGLEFFVDCYKGMPTHKPGTPFVKDIKMKVVDLARYDHFDYTAIHAPAVSTFFLYGDKKNAYITHIPNKNLDFLQLAQLGGIPEQVDQVILSMGVEITLTERDFEGGETEVSGLVKEGKEYQATFAGINGVETTTAIKIFKEIFEGHNVYGQ